MKKIIALFWLIIIPVSIIYAQSCLPQGITFSTQLQIDNFPFAYPNCTSVEGTITISGTEISDLSGLQAIENINGSLIINNNDILENLSGLNSLTTAGSILIMGNPLLQNLNGLTSLQSISGNFYIMNNLSLLDIDACQNLQTVGGSLWITTNELLSNINGLVSLETVGGELLIAVNHNLVNLNGLDQLSQIGGLLKLEANEILISLEALLNLESTAGLYIENCNSLQSLYGLNNLTQLSSSLTLKENASLIYIMDLGQFDETLMTDILIMGNPYLFVCSHQSICNYLAYGNGSKLISNNGVGCNGIQEVIDECSFVGIKKPPQKRISLYPNPAQNLITIESYEVMQNIEITDIQGRILKTEGRCSQAEIKLDCLKAGVYLVKIETESGNIYKEKLVLY